MKQIEDGVRSVTESAKLKDSKITQDSIEYSWHIRSFRNQALKVSGIRFSLHNCIQIMLQGIVKNFQIPELYQSLPKELALCALNVYSDIPADIRELWTISEFNIQLKAHRRDALTRSPGRLQS